MNRREFLCGAAAAVRVSPGVEVIRGAVNSLRFEREGRSLVVYGGARAAERVLFTHHRRDVAWAGLELVRGGAQAVAPAAERDLFENVDAFWSRWRTAYLHDYAQQSSKVLATPVAVTRAVRGGDRIEWRGLTIEVMDTPGYTRGAVSYLVETGGQRIAATGDLIYGDGRLLDLYSLQDSIADPKEDGYHGYAARAADLITSLRKIAAWKPTVLVPARGPIVRRPEEAITRLIERLQAVMASHFTIDALRWYRGDDRLRAMAGRILDGRVPEWMPMAETVREKLPEWIVPLGNARLMLSESGGAFLVDAGPARLPQQLGDLQKQGRFRTLEGIFITHYHDDHTNTAQAVAEAFACPVYATANLRDILERPGAYRMPATTHAPIRSVKVMQDGARQKWHEFEFTYYEFPGQTLYHDALLARKTGGENVFFIGDSFTPSGIDDYCLLNRNFFPPEPGFVYCLELIKKMPPDHLLINQHVPPAFRFSPAQIDFMLANYKRRRELMAQLVPFDDPGYGIDEQWAHFYPYAAEPQALRFAIRNHSARRQRYRVTVHVPEGWRGPKPFTMAVEARQESSVPAPVTSPAGARRPAVITASVAFGPWDLRHWAEALV